MRTEGRGVISVLIVAVVVAFYLLCNSSFFETDQIEWTSLNYLRPHQLDAFLEFSPINVWRLDSRELKAALLEHPWIVSANVRWRWPNRIIVDVVERKPIAQLSSSQSWFLLDGEGRLLPPPVGTLDGSLIVVTNINVESTEQLVSTARLISSIPDNLMGYLAEWNWDKRAFITDAGTEVLIGTSVDLEQKFLLLERILADLAQRGEHATRIDLRIANNPVVTTR